MSTDAGRSTAHDGDPSELLSAYLDDELTVDERALVDEALRASPPLRRELDELRATQTMLRALPLVEPESGRLPSIAADAAVPDDADSATGAEAPPGDAPVVSLDRHRRRRTFVGAAIGAVAAALLVVAGVGATLDPMPIAPSVEEFAAVHVGTSGTIGAFDAMGGETMDDPAVLPSLGDGLDRMAVYARDELVHTVYSDGTHDVSVFHEPGVVDWEALPADGEMIVEGPVKTWTGVRDETVVAITERGDLMVVIVADAEMGTDAAMEKTMEAVEMVPPVSIERGLWDRLSDAPRNLIDRI
ncbi:MAG: anti-sigma factor family protein [Acidimicrobiales bacterium]